MIIIVKYYENEQKAPLEQTHMHDKNNKNNFFVLIK